MPAKKYRCFCCVKENTPKTDDVMVEFFNKEFTEYEYIIDNLCIRPAPKKLLDLVPVHSTDVSRKSLYKLPYIRQLPGEPRIIVSVDSTSMAQTVPTTTVSHVHSERILEEDDGLRILPDEYEPPPCGPCNPLAKGYNPCHRNFPHDQKPCGACRTQMFPRKCQPMTSTDVQRVLNLKNNRFKTGTSPKDISVLSADAMKLKKKPRKKHKDSATDLADKLKNGEENSQNNVNSIMEGGGGAAGSNSYNIEGDSNEIEIKRGSNNIEVEHNSNDNEMQRISNTIRSEHDSNYSEHKRDSNDYGSKRGSRDYGSMRGSNHYGSMRGSNHNGSMRGSNHFGSKRGSYDYGPMRGSNDVEINRVYYDVGIETVTPQTENGSQTNAIQFNDQAADNASVCEDEKESPKKDKNSLKWKIIINKHDGCARRCK